MDKSIEVLAQETAETTQSALDSMSKAVVFANKHYLDGPFDRQLIIRRCREFARGISERYLLLGRDLLALKAHCDHGDFLPALDEIGIDDRQARSFMRAALKFDKPELIGLSERLSISKIIALASEEDEDLEALLNDGELCGQSLDVIEKMTVRELKTALRKSQQAREDEKLAYERVIKEKNEHSDNLATKLAFLQNHPTIQNWPQHLSETSALLADAGMSTRKCCVDMLKLMDARYRMDMPQDCLKSLCLSYINEVNTLSSLVGEMQDFVNRAFPQFVDAPSYVMSDALAMPSDAAGNPVLMTHKGE